ncbi:MAG: DUF393 domain-containing protein [Halobacteriales archaeon]|nr:DUF393 domain-containing protein [Halobacteriales archaeon]
MRSVLIYDGDCVYCSGAAKALRRLGDVSSIPWEHETAQRFLEDQFGEVPFAMFLVDIDAGVVYAGRSSAKELSDRAGMPSLASDIVSAEYDTISKVVGVASRREREPDDYHSVYDLRERARDSAGELANAAGTVPGSEVA